MKQVEPPSIVPSSRPPHFLIGKDSRGNWVVQDERGLCGGLFVDRTQALRFAMFENGNKPQAVVMVPGVFELNMNRNIAPAHDLQVPGQRKAA
jgi:hypothetical protein